MNKIAISMILVAGILFSGCAVHRFQKSEGLGGYAVARFGYVIPEYTVDLNKKAPADFKIAKTRFERRNDVVETYYLRMGQIESYFRRYVWHFPMIISSVAANFLKIPFHIVSEYRYDHDEQYRQRIDQLDQKQKLAEDTRIAKLRDELNEFIKKDLEKEEELNAASR